MVGNVLPSLRSNDGDKQCTAILHFPKNDEVLNQKWVRGRWVIYRRTWIEMTNYARNDIIAPARRMVRIPNNPYSNWSGVGR